MKVTAVILAIAVGALIIYDIVAILLLGESASISWSVYTWSKSYPVIPFAMGYVAGHLT
jgi:hypothetical protein